MTINIRRVFIPVRNIVNAINRTDSRVLLALLVFANFLSLRINADEEFYFAVAKQFMDNSWFPDSFAFNQHFGARWLYQMLIGSLLKYYSFTEVALVGKLILYGIIVYPIAKIAKSLSLSNFYLLTSVQLFILFRQSFFAGSHVFPGVVPQLFSHICILFAISFYLDKKWIKSFMFLGISMYWHVLVGGWMMLTLSVVFLFENEPKIKKFKILLVAYFFVLPYIIFLAKTLLIGSVREINGTSLDWIYVYFRAPNHLGIFKSMSFFYLNHLQGTIWLIVASITAYLFFLIREKHVHISLLRIVLVTFAINLIFVVISFFDKTEIILKFYPFRTQTFGVLLFLLISAKALFGILSLSIKSEILNLSILTFLILFSGMFSLKNLYLSTYPHDQNYVELISYVKDNTRVTDIFAFDESSGFDDPAFSRETMRKRLVEFKFVPAGGGLLYDWYQRIIVKEEAFVSLDFSLIRDTYKVTYICTSKKYQNFAGAELVFSNNRYFLYKLN